VFQKIFSQRLVNDGGIVECARDVRFQKDDICALHVALVVFPPDAPTEFHFRNVVIVDIFSSVAHRIVVLLASHHGL